MKIIQTIEELSDYTEELMSVKEATLILLLPYISLKASLRDLIPEPPSEVSTLMNVLFNPMYFDIRDKTIVEGILLMYISNKLLSMRKIIDSRDSIVIFETGTYLPQSYYNKMLING